MEDSEFDIDLVEGELSHVLGDSSTTSLISNALAELAKDAGGTVAAEQAKKEQDAAIAKAKAAGLPVPGMPGAKPPQGKPSALSKHYGGLPLYGWGIVGVLVIGASVTLAELLKKPGKK
jgi:hypothetical protein